MTEANPIPEGYEGIIPHLVVPDASAAIDFYTTAFDAVEVSRAPTPDGRLMHADILVGGAHVYLADPFPEMAPEGVEITVGGDGTNLGLHRFVEDVDAVVEKAVAAGATLKMPPMDMFWGDRYAQVLDPYGYEWPIATHVKDLTPEEMMAAQAEMMGGGA